MYGKKQVIDDRPPHDPFIDESRANVDFLQFKCYMNANRQMKLRELCSLVLGSKDFPDFVTLPEIPAEIADVVIIGRRGGGGEV